MFTADSLQTFFGKIAPPLRQETITGKGDPRGMVPVRHAGKEVTKTFWAKLDGIVVAGWIRN